MLVYLCDIEINYFADMRYIYFVLLGRRVIQFWVQNDFDKKFSCVPNDVLLAGGMGMQMQGQMGQRMAMPTQGKICPTK